MKQDNKGLLASLNFSVLTLVFSLGLVSSLMSSAQATERGRALFGLCISCHGAEGYGNAALGAPAIAGMPEWYLTAQLVKFGSGARGQHPTDDAGNRMRPMARTLKSDDYKAVAAYLATLKPRTPEQTVGGNIEAGKGAYSTCLACHGANGEGNQALNAPPLNATNDWYLVRQLHNFKNKVRAGDAAKDPTGSVMFGMASTLADEQAMKNVISYVQSLQPIK